MTTIPEGFAPHFRKSPVTDPWEPLYSRLVEGTVQIGFHAAAAHCNSRGFVHGGVIAALADNALGLSVGETMRGQGAPAPSGLRCRWTIWRPPGSASGSR